MAMASPFSLFLFLDVLLPSYLVLIHGYGANSRWQFLRQVRRLSHRFNLYVPDVLLFGESYTHRKDRTYGGVSSSLCVCEGLRRLGVDRFSIYGISYGGYVAYPRVEKVVIVSSGVGTTEEQIEEHLKKIERNVYTEFVLARDRIKGEKE